MEGQDIKYNRVWTMPNKNTFDIPAIKIFVKKYLNKSKVSIDPFARNKRWATYTNDLNPKTDAEYHMECCDFLKMLAKKKVKADLIIFDPPYSPRQTKECYDSIGIKMQKDDALGGKTRKKWRELTLPLLTANAIILSFGWNTVGMGLKAEFDIIEILLCCHGSDHNDTICMAEKRRTSTEILFDFEIKTKHKGIYTPVDYDPTYLQQRT